MYELNFTIRFDGSFVVTARDQLISGDPHPLASGHVPISEDQNVVCMLAPRGAERAPLERRRLLQLAARNLFRLVRG